MYYITYQDVNAWFESSKLALASQPEINQELHDHIVALIFGKLDTIFDVALWVDEDHTPNAVRAILAMNYAAWVYDKAYANDGETNIYADKLRSIAELQLQAIVSGGNVLTDDITGQTTTATDLSIGLEFFPNDLSSSNEASVDNPSDGPPAFSMGTVF